jgi:hypothetical protein
VRGSSTRDTISARSQLNPRQPVSIRSRHPLVSLVFGLLLVAMQYGGQLHAIEHIGDALRQTPAHSLTAPREDVCPLCALFAAGASAVASESQHVALAADCCTILLPPPAAPAAAAPSYYSSRAPPASL